MDFVTVEYAMASECDDNLPLQVEWISAIDRQGWREDNAYNKLQSSRMFAALARVNIPADCPWPSSNSRFLDYCKRQVGDLTPKSLE
jgi:hypothetical protein